MKQEDVQVAAESIIKEAELRGLALHYDGKVSLDQGRFVRFYLRGRCSRETYDKATDHLEDFVETLDVVPMPGELRHDDEGEFAPQLGFRLVFQVVIDDL